MKNTAPKQAASVENVFKLEGRVPLGKAIPFGMQHILAMFVSNLAPIFLIVAAAQPGLTQSELAMLLQNAMVAAGIASLIQMYPIWRVGSGLPVIMGVSFTFVAVLSAVAGQHGYGAVVGCVMIGGVFEGCLGLTAKYWRKIITPIVAACVVTAIGISLFTVGARSFGGGYNEDFGSWQNMLIAFITLCTCLAWNIFAKGYLKQLNVLAGLIVGYVLAICFGKVDLSTIWDGRLFALPKLMPFAPEFHLGSIISVCIIFLVSAAETIGDTSALCQGGLGRDITEKEISGTLAIDGFGSFISSLLGTPPVTSFSQNVGLVNMTKVVNRFTIMTGAVMMILAGFVPVIGNFFSSLPDCVLGGCTIMMFGSILASGIEMIAKAGFSQRNVTIISLSIAIGGGFTATSEAGLWTIFPDAIKSVFSGNIVAVVFVVAILLDVILPKEMGIKKEEA